MKRLIALTASALALAAAPAFGAEAKQVRVVSSTTTNEVVALPDGSSRIVPVTTTVTETTETAASQAGASRSALAAAATSCWIGTFTITKNANSLPLGFLYQWQHKTNWCGNGSRVTSVQQNYGVSVRVGFAVEYLGSLSNSGGAGFYTFNASSQGQYKNCYLVVAACNNYYPRHEGTYRANGTWGTVSWRNG